MFQILCFSQFKLVLSGFAELVVFVWDEKYQLDGKYGAVVPAKSHKISQDQPADQLTQQKPASELYFPLFYFSWVGVCSVVSFVRWIY